MKLKRLRDQVIVITGASSGIGLTTAKKAAQRGAKVVLTARNEAELQRAVREIRESGGEASYWVADVTDPAALGQVAEHAVATYGRIDTWVNDAGIAAYGLAEAMPLEDVRRVFDVTFWGTVYGSRAAIPRLRGGGALINVGSVVSDVSMPLLGFYVAAKHAVKGYTDVLRMELSKQGLPISVTLIKPSTVDTPFFEHARNYMEADPQPPPPVYSPALVADTILAAAERPMREVFAGGAAKLQATVKRIAPSVAERFFGWTMFAAQKSPQGITRPVEGSLRAPSRDGRERGDYGGIVRKRSAYALMRLHPARSALVGALLAAGIAVAFRLRA